MLTTPSFIFLAATAAYLAIRMHYQRKLAFQKTERHKSLLDKALVLATIAGQIVLPLVSIFSPLLRVADFPAPHAALLFIGGALMAAGVYLFWRSHADLGRNWSVTLELEKEHQLVTSGVYARVRHPMYASFFLMALGQAALLHNAVAGFAALVAVSLLYAVRTPREEAMLKGHFGTAYLDYMQRTGGVVPRLFTAGS